MNDNEEKDYLEQKYEGEYKHFSDLLLALMEGMKKIETSLEELKDSNSKSLNELSKEFVGVKEFFDDYKILKSVVQSNCYDISLLQSRDICPLRKQK